MNTSVLRPSGTGFEWCINQYHGCSHGCLYCYGMTTRRIRYTDWIQPKPRKDVIENLKKDIQRLKNDNLLSDVKDIFIGSVTDSYQPLEQEYKLTRQILEVLIENELPFTILTKGNLVLRDIDLLKGYRWCRAGVTMTSLNEDFRKTLEPGASPYDGRIEVLAALKANGISTYLSCEPLMPVTEVNPIEIIDRLRNIVDTFEFGKWTRYRYHHIPKHYWEQYCDQYYVEALGSIIKYCEENQVKYGIASHSKFFCLKHGLPFKPHQLLKPIPAITQTAISDFDTNITSN